MQRVLQIFEDGHERSGSLNVIDLEPGEQGNLQTLEAMAEIVRHDSREPDLRTFVLREIVRGVPGHDSIGECDAVFRYARDQIVYRQDPVGVERVADMWSTLYALKPSGREIYQPEGDCGIKATFIATCFALLGHRPEFVVIKQRENQRAYNHVYNAVIVDGELRHYDATPEDKPPNWEAANFEKRYFTIFGR